MWVTTVRLYRVTVIMAGFSYLRVTVSSQEDLMNSKSLCLGWEGSSDPAGMITRWWGALTAFTRHTSCFGGHSSRAGFASCDMPMWLTIRGSLPWLFIPHIHPCLCLCSRSMEASTRRLSEITPRPRSDVLFRQWRRSLPQESVRWWNTPSGELMMIWHLFLHSAGLGPHCQRPSQPE